MRNKVILIAALALLSGAAILFGARGDRVTSRRLARPGFVATKDGRFAIDSRPFRFVGANIAVVYGDDERESMPEILRETSALGMRVVRVWAFGESDPYNGPNTGSPKDEWLRRHSFRRGPEAWNEEAFVNIDRIIAEAARNHLYVQICLGNWWRDTGGVVRYLEWAGIPDAADNSAPFGINKERAMLFYTNEETRRLYRLHVEKIVARRNTVTGVLYRDDPTIMSYELMNEAQAPTGRTAERRAWVAEMSAYVRSLDPYHLITPGTWGYRTSWERREWIAEHRLPDIDFADVHNYPRDDADSFVTSPSSLRAFMDNRIAAAYSIGKPLVIGEFGIGINGHNAITRTQWINSFLDDAATRGVSGAILWILTRDEKRDYGITFGSPRDEATRAAIRRTAQLMDSLQSRSVPSELRDDSRHLVPHQFAFERLSTDPEVVPETTWVGDRVIIYRFKAEQMLSARFERLANGRGFFWGQGVGQVDYQVPVRNSWKRVGSVIVRARLQPVLPFDANGRVKSSRITLFINGQNCGSKLVPVEEPKQVLIQEWRVDNWVVRMDAMRGYELRIRFAVTADVDQPFGVNISSWPEEYQTTAKTPVEVEVRR